MSSPTVVENSGVVLPAACAVAASFDPALARSTGAAQGQQAHRMDVDANVKRSPLYGRNFALFSEDAYLTGALAAGAVAGVQSVGAEAAVGPFLCCNQAADNAALDRRVDERTLQEIYLPPFEAATLAGPQTLRCGSGTLNGIPLAEAAVTLLPAASPAPGTDTAAKPDHALAVQLAAQCGVLVQNLGALPMKAGQQVAYIGAFAETPRYRGEGAASPAVLGALDAALLKGRRVGYVKGFPADMDERSEDEFLRAVSAAEHADVAVVFAGQPESFVSPDTDRRTLRLPDCQNNLIARIAAVQKNTVVVLHTGAPVECPWAGDVSAVLCMYLAGEGVGEATDALLWGDANPSGRLPETWPLRLEDTPCYLDFPGDGVTADYREGVYVGYRWYDARKMPVRWPFGHGLSYTGYVYRDAALSADTMAADGSVTVRVTVKNSGAMAGAEVVQLYVTDATGTPVPGGRVPQALRGFQKVFLEPGEEQEITFTLTPRDLSRYSAEIHDWYAAPGKYEVRIGHSSRDIRATLKLHYAGSAALPLAVDETPPLGVLLADERTAPIIRAAMQANAKAAENGGGDGLMPPEAMAQMLDGLTIRNMINFGGPEAEANLLPMLDALKKAVE